MRVFIACCPKPCHHTPCQPRAPRTTNPPHTPVVLGWDLMVPACQDHSSDAVYVELPEVGVSVSQGKNFGAVESVKATSDINLPVSGEVVEVNGKLSEEPGLVNASPYEKGWIIKVKLSDSGELSSLMDGDKYSKFCKEEDAGIPHLKWFGVEGQYNVMVIDLLGPKVREMTDKFFIQLINIDPYD
eukprot:XP_023158053.1 glycine cleavage system H protein 2, mitochondrial-like [Zea mays]